VIIRKLQMVAVVNGDLSIANPARLSFTTITALAFAGQFVLVGEGSTLRCYDRIKTTSSCLLAASLFEAQAIHGLLAIHLRDAVHLVVAWGGAQVRVLVLSFNDSSEYVPHKQLSVSYADVLQLVNIRSSSCKSTDLGRGLDPNMPR